MIATVVLARLLAPQDFGIVTMVTTFSLLFLNFGLNGFTEAIVQRDEINHRVASNLFWINIAGSIVLTLAFAMGGRLLALLYKDPRIIAVCHAISITIFLTGLQVVPLALLKRAMMFSAVSANDICAKAVSVVVAIVCAALGWGYWALVAAAIAIPASSTLGAWILCRWLPGLPRRAQGTASATIFAGIAYGRFTMGYFIGNLDNFLVGWRLGPAPLGYYKKAYDLFALPFNQFSGGLTMVAVSGLSKLRDNVDQYKRYLLSALGVMALLGMAISGDLVLIGKDLILVLLGPKWGESGRLFTILAPGIGFTLLYGMHTWIHLSLGTAGRWFRWGMLEMSLTTVLLCSGLHWGAEGIAGAWVMAYCLLTLPGLWFAGKTIGIRMADITSIVWKYLAAASASSALAFFVLGRTGWLISGPGAFLAFVRVALGTLLFGIFYLGAVAALHRSFSPLYQPVRLVREVLPKIRRSASEAPAQERQRDEATVATDSSPAMSLPRSLGDRG